MGLRLVTGRGTRLEGEITEILNDNLIVYQTHG
jgi:hypothetical protein